MHCSKCRHKPYVAAQHKYLLFLLVFKLTMEVHTTKIKSGSPLILHTMLQNCYSLSNYFSKQSQHLFTAKEKNNLKIRLKTFSVEDILL